MANLRNIPAIDELLVLPDIAMLLQQYNRDFVVNLVRAAVDATRQELKQKNLAPSKADLSALILARLKGMVKQADRGSLQRVINGTGVVLHTNLGRAPLGERALENLNKIGKGYNNLEFDLERGERGSRYQHVEELLKKLTGAEAALVVNNNAAAVLLSLTCLARGREVIVSRGQLIEIGGAFRIPDVMKMSGAQLVEVGTTNKTYISDFAGAINENTAALFSAHTSNYKIVGFSQEVSLGELVELGRERKLPVIHDLGSGILTDLGEWGLKEEPTVQASVASGADIITFSGDKLLGGPQAGIIVGKKEYVVAMKKNQLTRALRVDKLNLAALEGTLLEYLTGDPLQGLPALKMLTVREPELFSRAQELEGKLRQIPALMERTASIQVVSTEDMVGGGAYPTYRLPGYGVEIAFAGSPLESIAGRLRAMEPALLTRKREDKMLISVRALLEGEDALIAAVLVQAISAEDLDRVGPGEHICKES